MATKRKTKRTAEERKAQVMALNDQLKAYKDGLNDQRIAQITARYDGYSERNALLIAMQRPTATDVSGFKTWQTRGRKVRKGEKGIAIFAPMEFTETNDDGNDELYRRFRVTYVFDIAQTDPLSPENN